MDGKFFQAPSPDPEHAILIATVTTWQRVIESRPMPRGGAISHVKQPGETFSQAEWRDIANRITKAIDGKDDDNTVRIWFDRDVATQLVDAKSAKK